MISLLCSGRHDELQKALDLNQEMVERGITRNVHTFSALMNVCIKAGQYQTALDVYLNGMQASGCQPNVVTYNTLIDLHGKMGQWEEAIRVMDKMKSEVEAWRMNCQEGTYLGEGIAWHCPRSEYGEVSSLF